VRELKNTIEHSVIMAKGTVVQMIDLPIEVHQNQGQLNDSSIPQRDAATIMAENEKNLIKNALEETGWNKKLAARKLGIARSTLYNKLKKFCIAPPLESEQR
jgi:two-component system response regulator HydG